MYDVDAMSYLFQFRRYHLPLRAPVRTAHGRWTEREGVLVRLETAEGAVAFGEAAVLPWFGTETADEAEAGCRAVGAKAGADLLASLPGKLSCVRNALAAAMGELEAGTAVRAKAVPYLGVAALLPAGRAALDVLQAKGDLGFRVFKWKVGVGDVADELSLLDDLCGGLPTGGTLRLDANGAWDRRRAERWLEKCAERPVEFVEQPVAPEARGADDLLRGLAEDFPTPIALDESVAGDGDIERWLGAGWRGVFVIKPALLGQVATTMDRLAKANASVVFSSALETAVGAKAALRVAFAWPGEARALGFGVWPLFADARFDGPQAAPFVRWEDVERINPEAAWNALN